MNKQYRKGYYLENKLVNMFKNDGMIAWRSAGSHSPIDVTVVNPKNMHVSLIQCKNTCMTEKELVNLGKTIKLKSTTSTTVLIACRNMDGDLHFYKL